MSEKKHISKTDFDAFQHDIMKHDDKVVFLEHICSCDYCSDQFAAMMSEVMMEAPRDLKANILKATKRPEVQLVKKARETSKRMQLLIYSLKVGTATALALLLLMFTMNSMDYKNGIRIPTTISKDVSVPQDDNVPFTDVLRKNMDEINNSMLNFSNNIMNTEVTNHD